MIVYVESNFVLEIALAQEQSLSADAILSLATSGKIELVYPSFALSEPFTTVMYRRGERTRLYDAFLKMLNQIKRTEPLRQTVQNLELLIATLRSAQKSDFEPLHKIIERMLIAGRAIEITPSSFREALRYQEELDLSSQDSIIYACIVADLQTRPREEVKCFLSRDKDAFSDEADLKDRILSKKRMKAELKSYGCRYISAFDDGLSFITSQQ